MTTEDDCVRALREAADRLGESPTKTQYEELGLRPAHSTILRVMGSWNEAKEAAGLETFSQSEGRNPPINRNRTGSTSPTIGSGPSLIRNSGGTTRIGSIGSQ